MSVATNLISSTRDTVQRGFPAEWLLDPRQVICSTTTSLFPLVARGLFDETLYHRLNVVTVRIRGRDGLE